MRYSRQLAQGQYESPTDDLKVFLDDAWTFVRNVNVRNLYLEVWAMGRHRPVVADSIKRIYTEYIQALILILRRINPTLTQTEAHTTATLISCLTEGAIVMATGAARTPRPGPSWHTPESRMSCPCGTVLMDVVAPSESMRRSDFATDDKAGSTENIAEGRHQVDGFVACNGPAAPLQPKPKWRLAPVSALGAQTA